MGKALLEGIETAKTPAERVKFVNLYRSYMLATNTLLRVAPIWCLQIKHIDLKIRQIKIQDNKELDFQNKSMKWPTKPINDELFEFLTKDLASRSKKEKYYLDKGDGSLWRHDRGDISRQMSIVCKSANLLPIKPFHHGMRATLITELLNRNVDPQVVQMLADHSSLSTTMSYRNTRTINQESAVNQLNDLKN